MQNQMFMLQLRHKLTNPSCAGNTTRALAIFPCKRGARGMTTPKHSIFSLSMTDSSHAAMVQRFWSYVEKTNSCWLWIGVKRRGYGAFSLGGGYVAAHRLSYELHIGPIPKNLLVLHNCPDGDNPACVNPAHLFIGTQLDNIRDMRQKKRERYAAGDDNGARTHPERLARGIRHGSQTHPESVRRGTKSSGAKLTEQDVCTI